jgi:hypothetical protein
VEKEGILYIAAGARYIRAAIRAAGTVRAHCPGLSIHLYADWQAHGFDFHASPDPFTSVGTIEHPHRRSKVDYLPRTPFERTLYLDTDTAVTSDIRGMFQLLDRFDVGFSHAHRRNTAARLRPWRVTLPDAFPQLNGGVILYRRSPPVLEFLDSWRQAYHEAGFDQDQVTLRELVWLSDLRLVTLPPEYNIRFPKYPWIWSRAEAAPRILHLRRYHDGPFWRLRKWAKVIGRPLVRAGFDPRRRIGIAKK